MGVSFSGVCRAGGDAEGIILWPMGGFALCEATDAGLLGDFKVAIAGPLTHIPQMAFWIAMYAAFTGGDFSNLSMSYLLIDLSESPVSFMTILSQQSFWTNLFIMTFNLFIPAYPLDGGRCLASFLIMYNVPVERAAMITSITAIVLSTALFFWGLVSFVWMHSPNGLFTALIASFVFTSSWKLWDLYRAGRAKEHPLFARACYNVPGPQTASQQESDGTDDITSQTQLETGTMA